MRFKESSSSSFLRAVILSGLILALFVGCPSQDPVGPSSDEQRLNAFLLDVFKNHRLFLAQLSFSGHHASPPLIPEEEVAIPLETLAQLQSLLAKHPVATSPGIYFQAKAMESLLHQSRKDVLTSAIKHLETAKAYEPESLQIALNLAAVYLTIGRTKNHFDKLPKAYELLQHLVRQKPDWFAAQYNLALVLESLGLTRQAKQAWQRALTLAPSAAWSLEIQQRTAELVKPTRMDSWGEQLLKIKQHIDQPNLIETLLDGHWDQARRMVMEELLFGWHDPEARALATQIATTIGTHDPFLQEVIGAIPPPGTREFNQIMRGFRLCKEAFQLSETHHTDKERALLNQANKAFDGHPYQLQVWYHLAELESRSKHKRRCLEWVKAILQKSEARGYLNLTGKTIWIGYNAEHYQRLSMLALQKLARMELLFKQCLSQDNLAGTLNLKAEYYARHGQYRESWTALGKALQMLPKVSKPKRHLQIFLNGTYLLWQEEQTQLALRFAKASLLWAKLVDDPWSLTTVHFWLVKLHRKMRQNQLATNHFLVARKEMSRIQSEDLTTQLQAEALLADAEGLEPSPQKVHLLNRVLSLWETSNHFAHHAETLCLLTENYLALGELELAQQTQAKAIALFEGDLARAEIGHRRSLLQRIGENYRTMAELYFQAGKRDQAFYHLELKGNRHMLAMEAKDSQLADLKTVWQPLHLRDIQKKLPQDANLLIFSRLNQQLHAWLIQQDQILTKPLTQDLEPLKTLISRFRLGLVNAGNTNRWQIDARALYQILIKPWEKTFAAGPISIVVDEPLYGTPFAALICDDGRFWVETRVLSEAPSASVFALALEKSLSESEQSSMEVSALGANHFPMSRYRRLPLLPGVVEEVQAIADIWGTTPHFGTSVTREAVMKALQQGGVVHLAGHALTQHGDPRQTKFLVSPLPDQPDSGELYAYLLDRHRFDETRLLVLSACSTASGPIVASEGVASLTHPFLAAGIPRVVASLWDVEDGATKNLMIRFHRNLRAGLSPAEALAKAQRSFIKENQMPFKWAGFCHFGSPY